MQIGVDFDNTLISYDEVFYGAALTRGWITEEIPAQKKAIRNHIVTIRGLDDWIELQSLVYTERIHDAVLTEACRVFLNWAADRKFPIYLVSHKTRLANKSQKDLQKPAMDWIRRRGLYDGSHPLLKEIYFEETLAQKLERIRKLGCTHFVDDLEEVLTHPDFPKEVKRILYRPISEPDAPLEALDKCTGWEGIKDYFERTYAEDGHTTHPRR